MKRKQQILNDKDESERQLRFQKIKQSNRSCETYPL